MVLTSSLFTHATNFASAVSGGVDPRTGLFNVQVTLGGLIGNRSLGPSLPLTLSYSPLTTTNTGFGQGVSLGLTTYDVNERLLVLSSGEQYRVQETDKRVVPMQHKLDTIRITRDKAANAYRVAHKSGDVEILTGPQNAFSLKVPTALLTPAGHRLTLSWDFTTGPLPLLTEVKDEHDTLLKVVHVGQSKTTLHVLPGQKEGYDVDLRFRDGLLGSVHHFGLDEPLVWDFTHTPVGKEGEWGTWITGATAPGGMSETAYYRSDGHRFPATAGLPAFPNVYRFVQMPGGGQAPVEASYDYTDSNFLGGHSEVDWNTDCDNLYEILTDYSYGSTESRTCGGQTTRITRTYNKYHLQTAERHQQNSCSQTIETQYYAVTGEEFKDQPPQFQLPKKKTATWTKTDPTGAHKSYQEVTETAFDEHGNPVSQTDPGGTKTEWTYYPAGGEKPDCPPEPNGFTRLLKAVTSTPPRTEFDAPVHTTRYCYGEHTKTTDPRVATAVLKSEEHSGIRKDRQAAVQPLRKKAFTYAASGEEFGRLTGTATTEYPADGGSGSYEALDTFSSTVDGDTLVQVHRVKTHDQLTATSSQTRSRFTRLLLSSADSQGNVTAMTYDKLGRLLTRTANPTPGDKYRAVETYTYVTGGPTAPFVAVATDALGNQVRDSYDGAGRLIRIEHTDRDDAGGDCVKPRSGDWFTVQTQTYDEQGRLATRTAVDRERGTGGRVLKHTETFSYDDWGQLATTASSDGSGQHTEHDPVGRTTTTQLLSGSKPAYGKTVTTYDKRGNPVSTIRVGLTGARTRAYDGLGRLRTETDELDHVTAHDYDARNRPWCTALPDGTQVVRAYEPFAAVELVTKLTVVPKGGKAAATKPYGERSFDGLSRCKTLTSGGRTWTYTYQPDNAPLPSRTATPDGKQYTYHRIPQLANALAKVEAGPLVEAGAQSKAVTITQDFTRNPISGAVIKAEGGGVTLDHAYYPSGRPCTTTTKLTNHPGTTAHTAYTVGGLEQAYTGADKTVRQITRDPFGRTETIADPAAKATLDYDKAGRITAWKTTDSTSGDLLTTELALDDFGRETKRTLTLCPKDKPTAEPTAMWTLEQTWHPNDLLSTRTLTRQIGNGPATKLRAEEFVYSPRSQLTEYTCVGDALPKDEHDRAITGQSFTYDPYGNVTTCTTSFTGGTDTASYLFENAADPCQLTRIKHTNPTSDTKLTYDASGWLTTDDTGRTLTCDDLGRLTKVGTAATYGYDPYNRLLTEVAGATTSVFSYHRQSLATITEGTQHTRLLRLGQACVALRREGTQTSTRLLGTDGKQTVLVAAEGKQHDEYTYTPYGDRRPAAATSVLGHDGERTDPATGWYHLGNGYRAYNPVLMRFTAPDSLSPFGPGGINPYAYCLGDPINRTDPTGHLSAGAWIKIATGAFAIALGVSMAVFTGGTSIAAAGGVVVALGLFSLGADVASGTTQILSGAFEGAAPNASRTLGWISVGTGVAAGAAGLGTLAPAVVRGLSRLAVRSLGAAEAAAVSEGATGYQRYLNWLPGRGGQRPVAYPREIGDVPSEEAQRLLGRASHPGEVPLTPGKTPSVLYHYTTAEGYVGINRSGNLRPSFQPARWSHAREGSGQYLTDLHPALHSREYISQQLVFSAEAEDLERFSHIVAIDVTGLDVVRPDWFRPHVYLVHGTKDLPVADRLVPIG